RGHPTLRGMATTAEPWSGTRGTGTLEPVAVGEDVSTLRAQAEDASSDLEGADPEQIIAWAAGAIPGLAVTSSFGAESAPLLHLVSRVAPELPVLFLETGFHFDETVDYRRRLARDLGLVVHDVRPE